jgi:hypothetical protein
VNCRDDQPALLRLDQTRRDASADQMRRTIGVEQTKRDLSRRDLDARQRKDVGGVEESSLRRLRPRGLVLAQ